MRLLIHSFITLLVFLAAFLPLFQIYLIDKKMLTYSPVQMALMLEPSLSEEVEDLADADPSLRMLINGTSKMKDAKPMQVFFILYILLSVLAFVSVFLKKRSARLFYSASFIQLFMLLGLVLMLYFGLKDVKIDTGFIPIKVGFYEGFVKIKLGIGYWLAVAGITLSLISHRLLKHWD